MKHDVQLALRVLKRIQQHRIENPITARALADEFQLKDIRAIGDVIEELRDAGHKIGSHKSKPMGYFLARDAMELQQTILHMESMGTKILGRAHRLKDWTAGQISIFEQQIGTP